MQATMMTVREAAQHFGVSDKTIRKWIKAGRLTAELRPGPTGTQYYVADEVIEVTAEPGSLERVPSSSPSTLDLNNFASTLLPSLVAELSNLSRAVEALGSKLDRLEQPSFLTPPPPDDYTPKAFSQPPDSANGHSPTHRWWQFWVRRETRS